VSLTDAIADLPQDWHLAGALSHAVIHAIERHAASVAPLRCTMETGCGKSTLLLSHLSRRHLVFALGRRDDSHTKVGASSLLNSSSVEWVLGPTQQTLLGYQFAEPLDLALIDGPHGYPFPQLEYWAIYPHLREGAVLIVDDIQIPTIYELFLFLKDDDMFELIEIVGTTAFFRRTAAPLFDPHGDGWWLQRYNTKRAPIHDWSTELRPSIGQELRKYVPGPVKAALRGLLRRRQGG